MVCKWTGLRSRKAEVVVNHMNNRQLKFQADQFLIKGYYQHEVSGRSFSFLVADFYCILKSEFFKMFMRGLTFIVYFLRLYDGTGFYLKPCIS